MCRDSCISTQNNINACGAPHIPWNSTSEFLRCSSSQALLEIGCLSENRKTSVCHFHEGESPLDRLASESPSRHNDISPYPLQGCMTETTSRALLPYSNSFRLLRHAKIDVLFSDDRQQESHSTVGGLHGPKSFTRGRPRELAHMPTVAQLKSKM